MGRIIFCFIIGWTILLILKLDKEIMSDDKATYEITVIFSAAEKPVLCTKPILATSLEPEETEMLRIKRSCVSLQSYSGL